MESLQSNKSIIADCNFLSGDILEGFLGLQPRENNNFPELNKSIKSQERHTNTIEGNHNAF